MNTSHAHGHHDKAKSTKTTAIRQVMTLAPHSIQSDQKLSAAHGIMRKQGIRHLPVLCGETLVGVLSQRDLYFLEKMAGVDIDIDRVVDAMTPDVYTTTPEALVRDVARTMADHKYGCAVVVEGGKVVGLFTATDALVSLANLLA